MRISPFGRAQHGRPVTPPCQVTRPARVLCMARYRKKRTLSMDITPDCRHPQRNPLHTSRGIRLMSCETTVTSRAPRNASPGVWCGGGGDEYWAVIPFRAAAGWDGCRCGLSDGTHRMVYRPRPYIAIGVIVPIARGARVQAGTETDLCIPPSVAGLALVEVQRHPQYSRGGHRNPYHPPSAAQTAFRSGPRVYADPS